MTHDYRWRRCGPQDAEQLGSLNAQLSIDEGGSPIGDVTVYVDRMRRWVTDARYEAALAEGERGVAAYVLWREDPDYGDVFVRQFFVSRDLRGAGLGRRLFE